MTSPIDTGAAEDSPPPFAAPVHVPAPVGDDWIVLTQAGAQAGVEHPVQMRRVVIALGLAAVLIAVIVGFAGSLLSRRIAENQAVHDVAQMTDLIADTVVQPALTDRAATDPAEAKRVLDPVLRAAITDSLVRVKLWSPSGTILYSDEDRLIGQRFALAADARSAFRNPHTQAEISDLQRPENVYERRPGKLLEVYRPVWTPHGDPLLFEAYFTYDTVSARSHELWEGFGGIMLSSLAALLMLMIPLGWLLLLNARRARAQREELMRRALDASEEERRRIAASLHDGVVQQLAAASFIAAGQAEQAASAGEAARAEGLNSVAGTVRDSIAGLRSLLVDIYPASLDTSGLAVALRDLARTAQSRDATVEATIDDAVGEALSTESQECVFRVAQEALRNALRHAGATRLSLSLRAENESDAVLEVVDNGCGFDAHDVAERGVEGHFGLRLMADAARRCGAELVLASTEGTGTKIRMILPMTGGGR